MAFDFKLDEIDKLPRLTEDQSRCLVRKYQRDVKREESSAFRLILPSDLRCD